MIFVFTWILIWIILGKANIAFREENHRRASSLMLGAIGSIMVLNLHILNSVVLPGNVIFLIVAAKLTIIMYLWNNWQTPIEEVYKIFRLIMIIMILIGLIASFSGAPLEIPSR